MIPHDPTPPTDSATRLAALRWLVEIGADEAMADAPQDRTRTPAPLSQAASPLADPAPSSFAPPKSAQKSASPRQSDSAGGSSSPASFVPVPSPLPVGRSQTALRAAACAAAAENREALFRAIREFDGIALRETATNTVFSDGDPRACVMLVGEAPGADEDRQGKPFVGVSGQLLDKVLASIGLSRTSDDPRAGIYISNILNWRPPGNRTPSDPEVEASLPFIERHIVLARPKLLILCGSVSANALLNSREKIGRLRGRWHVWTPATPGLAPPDFKPVPALATYHPSFLLRSPDQKRAAWADMRAVLKKRMELDLMPDPAAQEGAP
jgi:uracil-DNA glycosylase family 4